MKSIAENTFVASLRGFREDKFAAKERLRYYANVYTNSGSWSKSDVRKASDDLRRAATKLLTAYDAIPFKKFFSSLRLVPSSESIGTAYRNLIFLSDSLTTGKPMTNVNAAEEVSFQMGLAKNKPLSEQWETALDEAKRLLG